MALSLVRYFPSTYGGDLPSDVLECRGPSVVPRRGKLKESKCSFSQAVPCSSTPFIPMGSRTCRRCMAPARRGLLFMHSLAQVEKGVKYTINIWTFNQLKQQLPSMKSGKGHKTLSEL